ncbi:hypothetical protein [Amaricoccus sp.]|uniref:hypothetical protein n=1 Tax=Amaricoccus sp. TaxID=1872485 RepID=UPI001B5FD07A|nr:hypothetical protein [Amaricoccus sp.]MBP7242670.1 hypothetical protein [Amaricoccus sp.]
MPAPIPLAPLAWTALRLGAVAAVAIYAGRARSHPKDARREAVLDDLPDGVTAEPHRAEAERAMHGAGRFRRTFRLRRGGPGFEVDAAALGRFRLRRVG